MDILYIIGERCSKCDYFELKCSLRSIEKYGKNVGRVFVAGYCPDFLSDEVVKVPVVDQPYEHPETQIEKHINILYTILYVVDNTDISNDFLVSMDDHFYIKETDFDNYPFYCKIHGEKNKLPLSGKTEYKQFLAQTRQFLHDNNLTTYYLTLHRNMHCNKTIIAECRSILNQVINNKIACEPMAFILNYWNTNHEIEITPVEDVKLNGGSQWWKADPRNTEVFSTVDFEPGIGLYTLIEGLYPNKSKYENNE